MDNSNHTQIHDRMKVLLEKIKNNEVTVKSKNYFRLKLGALVVMAVLVLVTSIFLFSFIIFNIRISGQASFLGFGLNGLTVFLLLFPWKLLIIDIVFLCVFEYLLRSFRFGYKIPVLYLLLALLFIIVASGYVVDRFFPVHDQLLKQASQNHLPTPIAGFYKNANRQQVPPIGHNIFRGVVVSVGTSTFEALVENPREATSTLFTIILPNNIDIQTFTINERVFISGPIIEGKIKAFHVTDAPAPRQ